jgi:hypothetical protein
MSDGTPQPAATPTSGEDTEQDARGEKYESELEDNEDNGHGVDLSEDTTGAVGGMEDDLAE